MAVRNRLIACSATRTRDRNNICNFLCSIDPNLKSTVYCTALRTGGEEEWQFAFDLYKSATVAAEKSRLLSALSCTSEPWLLYRYFITFEFQHCWFRKITVRSQFTKSLTLFSIKKKSHLMIKLLQHIKKRGHFIKKKKQKTFICVYI